MPGHRPASTIPNKRRRRLDGVSIGGALGVSEILLKAPSSFHRRHAGSNYTDADHDTAHPHMRTQAGHDQVGRQIEYHIADIEEGETR